MFPFEAPPSPELVDAVLEAVGNLTGKTFGSLRKHFLGLSQDKLSFFNGLTAMEAIKYFINNEIAATLIRHTEQNRNSDEAGRLSACMKAASAYFKMVESLSGIEGIELCSTIFKAGLRIKGLADVFKLLPTKAEYDAAASISEKEAGDVRSGLAGVSPWMKPYSKFLKDLMRGRPAQPKRPSNETLEDLREDFSEVIDIIKAAMPYREQVSEQWLKEQEQASQVHLNLAEQEAKFMFGLIDEDEATAAFDKAVAEGYEAPAEVEEEDKYAIEYAVDSDEYDAPIDVYAKVEAPTEKEYAEYVECDMAQL